MINKMYALEKKKKESFKKKEKGGVEWERRIRKRRER